MIPVFITLIFLTVAVITSQLRLRLLEKQVKSLNLEIKALNYDLDDFAQTLFEDEDDV